VPVVGRSLPRPVAGHQRDTVHSGKEPACPFARLTTILHDGRLTPRRPFFFAALAWSGRIASVHAVIVDAYRFLCLVAAPFGAQEKKKPAQKLLPVPPVPLTAAKVAYGKHERQVLDSWQAKEWNLNKKCVGATGGSAGACSSLWPDQPDPKYKSTTDFLIDHLKKQATEATENTER
jgi:hypothetical protein